MRQYAVGYEDADVVVLSIYDIDFMKMHSEDG